MNSRGNRLIRGKRLIRGNRRWNLLSKTEPRMGSNRPRYRRGKIAVGCNPRIGMHKNSPTLKGLNKIRARTRPCSYRNILCVCSDDTDTDLFHVVCGFVLGDNNVASTEYFCVFATQTVWRFQTRFIVPVSIICFHMRDGLHA